MKILNLLAEMRDLLLLAGVSSNQINIRTQTPKTDTLLNAFDWLHDLKMSETWRILEETWALLPEETWNRYDAFGITGLREQILLDAAKAAVLKAWRTKRPKIFGTVKKNA